MIMTDTHMQLCISEHAESAPLPCQYCGGDSAAHASDEDGWLCERCSVKEGHEWGEQCAFCGHGVNDSTYANKYEELICADCHKSLTDNRKRQLKEESDGE